ncbi:PREDICTED: uncharacterized protein LOC105459788, partial [Wasmannia auropunctata]|uniref:uncharacterized protein LOC105459788 n=1 Tax=Wasmannia auropunctata TaxID=64793 RepID=UPI0005EEEAC1
MKDPVGNVHKIEELLWRKAFYDVVYTAKKLRKGNTWNDMEKMLLSAHLLVTVGYYHHLIIRLQMEYDLDRVASAQEKNTIEDFVSSVLHISRMCVFTNTELGMYLKL